MTLRINIICGDSLSNDFECNTYLIASLEGASKQSEIFYRSSNPQWNFQWNPIVTSLGTDENPTLLEVEVWKSERFWKDKMIGNVTIPIKAFLIKNSFVNWFSLKKDATEKNPPKIQVQINYDEQNLKAVDVDDKEKAITESVMIFINKFQNGTLDNDLVKRLQFEMQMQRSFLDEFIKLQGIEWLFYEVARRLAQLKSPLFEKTSNEDFDIAWSILLIIFEFGLEFKTKILSTPDYVRTLLKALPLCDNDSVMIVFYIFRHLLSPPSQVNTIAEGLKYFMFVQRDAFDKLVEELVEGDHILFKVMFLEFLNNIIISPTLPFETREEIRENFNQHGINAALYEEIKQSFPDDEIIDQVNNFLHQEEIDNGIREKSKARVIDKVVSMDQHKLDKLEKELLNANKLLSQKNYMVTNIERIDYEEKKDNNEEKNFMVTNIKAIDHEDKKDDIKEDKKESILEDKKVEKDVKEDKIDESNKTEEVESSNPDQQDTNPHNYGLPFKPDDDFVNILENLVHPESLKSESTSTESSKPSDQSKTPNPPGPQGPPGPPPGAPKPPEPVIPKIGLNLKKNKEKKTAVLRLKKISPNAASNTIFASLAPIDPSKNLNKEQLVEFFTEDKDLRVSAKKPTASKLNLTLIEPNRHQNLEIFLKRNPVPAEHVIKSVLQLSLQPGVSPEYLEMLPSIFSKKESQEMETCANFKGDISTLQDSEKFLCKIYSVPRFIEKLEILTFVNEFSDIISAGITYSYQIKAALKKLKDDRTKVLLSYILDAANILSNGPALTAFSLSSLTKVAELKSPTNHKTTLLHYLVSKLDSLNPEVISFACENAKLFQETELAIAYFQALFPLLIEKLWGIEKELNQEKTEIEMDFYKELKNFRDIVINRSLLLNRQLSKIDDEIIFLGNNENDLETTEHISEIRKVWSHLVELGIISSKVSKKRCRRDEDRYSFFLSMGKFFTDVKNARAFVVAQKHKENKSAQTPQITSPAKKAQPLSSSSLNKSLSTSLSKSSSIKNRKVGSVKRGLALAKQISTSKKNNPVSRTESKDKNNA